MKKLLSGILSVAAALLPLQAEVYWLGPGRGGRNSDKIAGILPGMEKVLYTEKITVNSYAAKMEISAVTGDVEEIASLLRKMKLDKLSISGGTIRFERKLPSGMIERFLIVASRRGRPLTCFRMKIPEKLPPPGEWPSELPPLPPGAEITAVTRLGGGGVCGEFRNAQEAPYILLRRVDAQLRNRKMFAAGDEVTTRSGGRGEIFYSKAALIWVNFSDTGHGAFFYRPRQ